MGRWPQQEMRKTESLDQFFIDSFTNEVLWFPFLTRCSRLPGSSRYSCFPRIAGMRVLPNVDASTSSGWHGWGSRRLGFTWPVAWRKSYKFSPQSRGGAEKMDITLKTLKAFCMIGAIAVLAAIFDVIRANQAECVATIKDIHRTVLVIGGAAGECKRRRWSGAKPASKASKSPMAPSSFCRMRRAPLPA